MTSRATVGPLRAAAVLALAALATGCAAGTQGTPEVLRVAVQYDPAHDLDEAIPSLRMLNEPAVDGMIRKSAARVEIDGRLYEGERLEIVQERAFGAPGEPYFQILARRFAGPEPHLDLRIEAETGWQLFLSDFVGGRLVDAASGKPLPVPTTLDPGTYHLKAYK